MQISAISQRSPQTGLVAEWKPLESQNATYFINIHAYTLQKHVT